MPDPARRGATAPREGPNGLPAKVGLDTAAPRRRRLSFVNAYRDAHDPLDALGDATRRAIVEGLRDGERTVGDLATGLPVSRPAVSQHLGVLKAAGLVLERPQGTRRYYRLDPIGLTRLQNRLDTMWGAELAVPQAPPPIRSPGVAAGGGARRRSESTGAAGKAARSARRRGASSVAAQATAPAAEPLGLWVRRAPGPATIHAASTRAQATTSASGDVLVGGMGDADVARPEHDRGGATLLDQQAHVRAVGDADERRAAADHLLRQHRPARPGAGDRREPRPTRSARHGTRAEPGARAATGHARMRPPTTSRSSSAASSAVWPDADAVAPLGDDAVRDRARPVAAVDGADDGRVGEAQQRASRAASRPRCGRSRPRGGRDGGARASRAPRRPRAALRRGRRARGR